MSEPATFDLDAARRIAKTVRAYEAGEPGDDRRGRGRGKVAFDCIVTGATPVSGRADAWDYTVRIMIGGHATSFDGLQELNGIDWPARNKSERETNAGYVSTAVTGIRAIPNGRIVEGKWSKRNGADLILFTWQNEPICSGGGGD